MSFSIPKTITFDGGRLAEMKTGGKAPQGVLAALRERADKLLETKPFSVTRRNKLAPSKNPHDYCSMGTYWWPDETKPDGLPYVRRDGYTNPEGKEVYTPQRLFESIQVLTLASYYTEDMSYAEHAVSFIREWYVNEHTRMTPNARFAQCIPGICDGRGIGLIDFAVSYKLFDSVRILEAMGAVDEDTLTALSEWYRSFSSWMQTSDCGREVCDYHNNHGTWYNVQLITSALFTGDAELAKELISKSYESRVLAHIAPDGSIPHELSRTKAYNYSLFDLRGLCIIANVARSLGDTRYVTVDAERGHTVIRQAIDFIYGAIMNPDEYLYREIHLELARTDMTPTLLWAEDVFGGGYAKLAEPHLNDDMIWRLLPAY